MNNSTQEGSLIQFDTGDAPVTSLPPNEKHATIISAPVSAQNIMENISSNSQLVEDDDDDDLEERSVDDLMVGISDIDREITEIRFNKSLSKNTIIEEINDLMEKRNKYMDVLQNKRNAEFKSFVNSLNLPYIQITPFFGKQRKCTLQISDEAANEILKSPPAESQKRWSIHLFKQRSSSQPIEPQNSSHNYYSERQISDLNAQYKQFNSSLRTQLHSELEKYEKKQYLSPDDMAAKTRINAELEELERFSHEKK